MSDAVSPPVSSPAPAPPSSTCAAGRPGLAAAGRMLCLYGGYLVLVAVAAVFYLPVEGRIGFNADAKTALMSGGMSAGVSIVLGVLVLRGARWASAIGLGTTTLFASAFLWRSIAGWMDVAAGAGEKAYAATLITSMLVASVLAIGVVAYGRGRSAA